MGKARPMFILSGALVVLSLFAIFLYPGLNYGTDFRGGTEVRVELSKPVEGGALRDVLSKAGFASTEVVRVSDPARPNFYSLRMGQVSTLTNERTNAVKASLESSSGKDIVSRVSFSEGADRFYVRLAKELPVSVIEQACRAAGVVPEQVQRFGRASDRTYEIMVIGLDKQLRQRLDGLLGPGTVKDIPSIESVGAKAGAQLRNDGAKATIYAMLLILLYVAVRFDFRFAPGGVVAIFHDVLIVAGAYAVSRREFNLTSIAALLTIAGYSINDTIVVFDRVRENMGRSKERKLEAILNTSLSETLSRTILTNVATMLSVVALLIFGTGTIRDFAFALTVGFVVGTYSTLYIASPIVLWLDRYATKAGNKTQSLFARKGSGGSRSGGGSREGGVGAAARSGA
jgi:preprotein translocase subunit SecF